jgi:hypothetical protein
MTNRGVWIVKLTRKLKICTILIANRENNDALAFLRLGYPVPGGITRLPTKMQANRDLPAL